MLDLQVVFARLWGWHECTASYNNDYDKAEFLMEYDSIDLYELFEEWEEEFMEDHEQDPNYFFEAKMRELCKNIKEEN